MVTPVPPSDITPADFFERWLPEQYQAMRANLAGVPPDGVIRIELTGDQGGVWVLRLSGGDLAVAVGAGDGPANIEIRQSVVDWRQITTRAAAEGGDPTSAASIDRLLASPALGQLFHSVKGTIRVQISGLEGRDFSAEITFGGAAEPSTGISVDADTLEQIRSGALPAPQAFFSGRIQITGEPALAMQVGMAFMS